MKEVEPFTELGQREYKLEVYLPKSVADIEGWKKYFDIIKHYAKDSKYDCKTLYLKYRHVYYFVFYFDCLSKITRFEESVKPIRGKVSYEELELANFPSSKFSMVSSLRIIYGARNHSL